MKSNKIKHQQTTRIEPTKQNKSQRATTITVIIITINSKNTYSQGDTQIQTQNQKNRIRKTESETIIHTQTTYKVQ